MSIRAIAFLAALTFSEGAVAQTDNRASFLRQESTNVPSNGSACDTAFPSRIPVRCWAGQKFLVLPMASEFRHYGYQMFNRSGDMSAHASYDELAGKIVTVTDVRWEADALIPDLSGWVITFKSDDAGNAYTTRAGALPGKTPDDATVEGLALLRDMKAAAESYRGKTYWITQGWLPQLGENGSISFSNTVTYKKYMPVTVTDILASYSNYQPIRVVVRNDAGQEGYFDMAASQTNRQHSSLDKVGAEAFEQYLVTTDPKLAHKWPAKIWDDIENQKVFVGMTAEQARMSWGEPSMVNRTTLAGRSEEQWVYGSRGYLYVTNGTVSAIQN